MKKISEEELDRLEDEYIKSKTKKYIIIDLEIKQEIQKLDLPGFDFRLLEKNEDDKETANIDKSSLKRKEIKTSILNSKDKMKPLL